MPHDNGHNDGAYEDENLSDDNDDDGNNANNNDGKVKKHDEIQVRSIHCCLTPGCLTALQPSVITSKSSFLPSVFPPRI